ncbi:MAG TPA: phage baseplate assembly protein V [Actinophytocola sp.]|uniref:phage baseplate assembly protein V n=1 Tax=Actinophytocola sp. TaxID=1872138 RepID=UPI002DB7E924|nr:phage baseplate assembly protein V [Actinophytocola sp.]HEU5474595.1 phage baseplate assembly protein V [Actinophytocola sp.]
MTSLLGGSFGRIVHPVVMIGSPLGLPLGSSAEENLIRTVVDTHLHLPDMFEMTFLDDKGSLADDAGLAIGTKIEIKGGKESDEMTTSLIKGEVTSIEAICQDNMIFTVVRGYEQAHRLQRAKRTKTYVNMTDSDIAKQVARNAGLTIGDVAATSVTHDHMAQVAQTDWDFLSQRAREIGYETGVAGGEFFFRPASGAAAGGGLGGMASAAAGALGLDSGKLMFKDNLMSFFPRISAANITPDVEVRMWDSKDAKVVASKTDSVSGTATIDGQVPKTLANSFTDGFLPPLPSLPALPPIPGLPKIDFGTAPSNTAYVVVDRPLAFGPSAARAAEEAAKGVADHIASTFAEAEGDAMGDPAIQAGAQVDIDGVPKQFIGKWTVTNARHIFDSMENGYHTRFWVSGRQNRNLLGLTAGARDHRSQISGLVCGVVTNVSDPDKLGRVKVALPWLSPDYESDWARVVQVGAGPRSGALFLPEVGDEVLIGFEFGDPRRGYVLGGLINSNSKYGPLSSAVSGSGAVNERGFATPAGNKLLFTDDLPPGPPGAPPIKSSMVLGTKDDKLSLTIDQVAGTITLSCNPAPPASKTPSGTLTIECPGLGAINIKAGTGGIKMETDGQLQLTGKMGVKIESPAITEVKGSMLKLN